MIRVYLGSNSFPESFLERLKASGEIQFSEQSASADVCLCLAKAPEARNIEKACLVIYEKPGEITGTEESGIRIDAPLKQLLAALQAAASGLLVRDKPDKKYISEPSTLTPRELEVLGLIADGEGNKSIAYILDISEHTVKFHITSIFEKLDVSSRTEAVKIGIRRGLIFI